MEKKKTQIMRFTRVDKRYFVLPARYNTTAGNFSERLSNGANDGYENDFFYQSTRERVAKRRVFFIIIINISFGFGVSLVLREIFISRSVRNRKFPPKNQDREMMLHREPGNNNNKCVRDGPYRVRKKKKTTSTPL